MFNSLGPMDIECDAPHYSVVEACGKLGFRSPLDVRWCRTSRFLGGRRKSGGGFHPWLWLFGGGKRPRPTCTCGQPLPIVGRYTCTFTSGKEVDYLLGQCRRCRTMFWDAAAPTPAWVKKGAVG